MRTAPQGLGCKDLGFMDYRLCKVGFVTRPCVNYPTFDSNSSRKSQCSRIMVAEVDAAHVSQGTKVGSNKRVIPKYLIGWSFRRSPIHHIVTSIDGTVKVLLRLEDNKLVEAVGILVKALYALKCRAVNVLLQVLVIEDVFRKPMTNIAFMGMGEPLMNVQAVLDAHRTINKELKIAQPMMNISTIGVVNTIRRFATYKLHSPLVVSLHAANQELRSEIVLSAKRYPLDTLMEDCRFYYETTRGRMSFEYTLLAGVNDRREHAEELATLLCHWNFSHINFIPYNPIADSAFERPTKRKVLALVETLAKREVTARVRLARGLDVNAACG